MPTDSTCIAWGLPAALAAQRIGELAWSRRNRVRSARAASASADTTPAFAAMVALHVGLIALPPLERIVFATEAPDAVAWSALAVFAGAQVLRYAAIAALGPTWNVRAVVAPELGVSTRGPYRWMRHPNYLAVLIEFSAVPLALGAWRAWILLNALHAPVLWRRIRNEERLLAAIPGYSAAMAEKGGILPRFPSATRRARDVTRSAEEAP